MTTLQYIESKFLAFSAAYAALLAACIAFNVHDGKYMYIYMYKLKFQLT